MKWLFPAPLSHDARLLLGARGLRGLGDGMGSLLLPLYLTELGYGPFEIGALATASLLGSAALTLGVGWYARAAAALRPLMLAGAALIALTGLSMAALTSFWPLLLISIVGTITPTGGDVSILLPLEQSMLAGQTEARTRTALFARYSLIGSVCSAIGALCIGLPAWLHFSFGLTILDGLRALFLVYAALGLACALLYAQLRAHATGQAGPPARLDKSRRIVWGLAALFAIDSFGSGFFVQSLLATWLIDRFDIAAATAGAIFFWAGLLSALSYLVASWLSTRIGLINTMVFTHIPANLCLIALPFTDSLWLTVALMLVRGALSQMDVPTRTSYVMAVVSPEERPAAASITAVPRTLASALSPMLAGHLFVISAVAWPLVIGGLIKIGYDLALLCAFRAHKPPEER